jgi:hypothetical protein
VQESPLRGELGPGAVVVASGQAVFWVRNGASGDDLWCVDASSGRPVHHWVTPGVVASTAGAAVVATSSGAAPLFLRGCAG